MIDPRDCFGLSVAGLEAHNHASAGAGTIRGGGMKDEQVTELLYQALETELGGVQVYTTAIRCAQNDDLKEE